MMRILLIDDHALFRFGLKELLEQSNIDVIGTVADGHEGIRLALELQPDIILLDLRMPQLDGLEILQYFQDKKITQAIVILTTSDAEQDLVKSLRYGAKGYLLKDMDPDELVDALTRIQAGETMVAKELTGVLAKVIQGGQTPDYDNVKTKSKLSLADLTPREGEILCHLAEGKSNKAIAKELGISDGTVKLHVKSILRKLNVHSRVEAAVMAVEQGVCQNEKVSGSS
jgi:two-component system nitrate/nitrite response regulator NarL